MTDNTDREKLIQEASDAMHDVYSSCPPFGGLDIEGMARAALAVFEKEDKIMTDNTDRGKSRGRYTDTQVLYMVLLALEEGLDGVRRQDLDDLLVKMIAEHWGTAGEDASPDEAEAAFAQLEPHIPERMLTPEPQGEVPEPSTEPDALCGDWPAPCNCDDPVTHDGSVPASIVQSERAEPSDAQVEAALQALGHSRSGVTPPAMRAALRAASSVTKGENHE